ncbi:hypothetical protein BN946_scf184871.g3 [Trametes cinnabarina]|uniref:Alcohol dehydrogenase iron-type/glycerol dehydrogenase GldA domain-containing protein n=1 Tax=Pycnoporus cinnabarinus TaxID=5643 RepID=A0A060SLX7_PYCCI|nr:hypothetical protein BN946_scf184871.g3 [Trametes cinnabarina]
MLQAIVVAKSYSWTEPLRGIFYGPGSIRTALPKLLAILGAKKALVVTTALSMTRCNILKERNAYGATFYEIGQHAPIAGIRNGLKQFKDVGADVIVSVGGGSPVDAAKAIVYFQQQDPGGSSFKQTEIPATRSAAEYTASAGCTDEGGCKASQTSS